MAQNREAKNNLRRSQYGESRVTKVTFAGQSGLSTWAAGPLEGSQADPYPSHLEE